MAPVRSGASRKPGHTRFNIHTPHPPGGDSAHRRTLAAALVHPGREATPDDVALVARHLADTLSAKELRRIARDGMGFRVTEGSVGHQKPEWNAMAARGYSAGNAVGGRPGTYDEATREVIIATIPTPTGARRVPDSTDSTSADVALHELGHGINRREALPGQYLSESPAFEAAYVADAGHGPLAGPYYHQLRRRADKYDGARDEAFAESFAMFVRQPDKMHREYPGLYAYFEKLLSG
jgi:hypothetical protein